MKFLFRISIFLVILILGFVGIAIYHTFYNQLPDHTARISVEGLDSPVDVRWDTFGVPYIKAESDEDLYFAIGYLHAQDRLWQLTLSQLMAEGRFAEFLGEEFIEIDKHQRTLGIWRTSERILENSSDTVLTALEHYANGINAFTKNNPDRQPIEMTLLDIEPIKWTPTHSIAAGRLMAWDQSIHWKSELAIAQIGAAIGNNRVNQLLRNDQESILSSTAQPDFETLESVQKQFAEAELKVNTLLQKKGTEIGSNAWAVSGGRTASGQPILAGDPHMGLSIPGFWYELQSNTPDLEITGATIPGSPFVILGQNNMIAWSITNMMADDMDFYLIQDDPEDPDQYVADSSSGEAVYEDYTWQREIIKVKERDDYLHRIPHTRHGPIINNAHPDSSTLGPQPVAMRWAGHEVTHEQLSLYRLNRAKSLQEFREALSNFGSPAMNFIYADQDDNIALLGAGHLPDRPENAVFFMEGWNPGLDWTNWIPREQLPREINPERGYVAHANNKVHNDSYPYYIGRFWASTSRISRINYLLEQGDSVNAEMMQEMQTDIYSEHAADLTEVVLPLIRSAQQNNEFEAVLTYLENWDHQYTINSTAASIFELFFKNLSEIILKRDIPDPLYEGVVRLENLPVRMATNILTDRSSFFNIADEESEQYRVETIRTAMNRTLGHLTENFGPEPFNWRWEALHTLTLKPPLLSELADHPDSPNTLKLIVNNLLSEGPHAVPGHGMTINKAEYSWNNPFTVILGPSIRRIVDFSNPSRTYSVLPTGQSGQSLSANYGDQIELWLDGRYRYIYSDSTFSRAADVRLMKLEPLSIH